MTPFEPEEEHAGSAEEMLALMREQRRATRVQIDRRFTVLLIVWAVAWGIGFLALWSAETVGGNPLFRISEGIAWPLFGILMVTGVVWSIVTGALSGRHVRGRSRLAGALYGWSWSVAMTGGGLFVLSLQRAGLSDEMSGLLYPGLFILLVGVLYMGGAALDLSPAMFALGVAMIATVAVATWVGAPTHYLLYGTVGPVALVLVAALQARGVLAARAPEQT